MHAIYCLISTPSLMGLSAVAIESSKAACLLACFFARAVRFFSGLTGYLRAVTAVSWVSISSVAQTLDGPLGNHVEDEMELDFSESKGPSFPPSSPRTCWVSQND